MHVQKYITMIKGGGGLPEAEKEMCSIKLVAQKPLFAWSTSSNHGM